MNDIADVLRDYLLTKTALTTLVGSRIWAQRVTPKEGYVPSDGAALVFWSRGSRPDYTSALLITGWGFKSYGTSIYQATAVDRALYDALQDAKGAYLHSAVAQQTGQYGVEPDLGWLYIRSFYETMMLAQPA